jgi:hypothetical protein
VEEKRARRTLFSGSFPGIFSMVKGGLLEKRSFSRAIAHKSGCMTTWDAHE